MDNRWIVVQTKINREIMAHKNLTNQGFEVFFPKIYNKIRSSTRIKKVLKPLFPGYIFVKLSQNFTKIKYTYGVSKIVSFGESLSFLPHKVFHLLKNKCDLNDVCKREIFLKKGDKITLEKKNSSPIECIFEEVVDNNRSIILISLLNREFKTLVNNKFIY